MFHQREGNGVADRIAKEFLLLTNYGHKLYSIMPSWVITNVEVDKQDLY